mgnify:CR=1 FL=1
MILNNNWKRIAEEKYCLDNNIDDISSLSDSQKKDAYEEVKTYSIFLSEENLKTLFNWKLYL